MRRLFRIEAEVRQPFWLRALSFLVLIGALGSMLLFLTLACLRLVYPFELEWIEGANIDEMRWILGGNALYGEPTISFIPLAYNPLYFYLSAGLMKVIGVGFVAPRLISILSTLGCFLLLFLIVSRDSEYPLPGIIAAGVYAAAFRFAGAWMDIAKTDSLFLCLVLAAFFIGRRYPNRWGMVLSGLFYVLAYYTKQLALPIILIMAPLSLIESLGRTWLQWLTVAIIGIAIFLSLDTVSDGWFSFYSLDTATYHARTSDPSYFWRSLASHIWPAILIGFLYPILTLSSMKADKARKLESLWHNLGLGVASLLTSWGVFLKVWTYDNGFMPACAGLAMLTGLGYGQILKLTQRASRRERDFFLRGGVLLLILLQFATLAYNPLKQLPTSKDREASEQFIDLLSNLPGKVLVYRHGLVSFLAGKESYLHIVPYGDVMGGVYPPRTEDYRWRREKARQVFRRAISQQVFEWVIEDKSESSWLPYYIYVDNLFDDPEVLYPATGAPSRPESLMRRNPLARGGVLPLIDASFNFLFGEGWSASEDWGRWAVGKHSVVQVALEQEHDYELTVEAFPFCPPQFTEQVIKVGWNNLSLGEYTFTSCDQHPISFRIPSEAITEDLDTLWLEFEHAASPADLGLSGDQRSLAVGFTAITFAQQKR